MKFHILGLHNLATLYYRQGKLDKAEGLLQKSLAMRQTTFGEKHLDVAQRFGEFSHMCYLLLSYHSLGYLKTTQGKYEEAENFYKKYVPFLSR